MTLSRPIGIGDLCHNFVKTWSITVILVLLDSTRRALSNELSFAWTFFIPKNRPYGLQISRGLYLCQIRSDF